MTPISANASLVGLLGAPIGSRVELRSAYARIFMDGRNGLNSNVSAGKPSRTALRGCISCCKCIIPGFCVIDGDKWAAKKVHSSDWIMFADTPNGTKAFQVDGKLGLDFEYPGDKSGSSVTMKAVLDKYRDTISLSASRFVFLDLMILIVPRHGREAMWRKVRRWCKAISSPEILTCCAEEFLTDVMGLAGRSCDMNESETAVRRAIFKRLLDQQVHPNPLVA